MRDPLKITLEDIAKLVTSLEEKGVGLQMSFIPLNKDTENEESNSTEKGGVDE